jgi:four helix bundle protein
MKIARFEDLEVWKEGRLLVNMVYNLTDKPLFKKDFGLKEQIQRAAVSCMLNVAEGLDSDSNSQFIQYLVYARRSSSEVQSVLYVALDRRYITQKEFENAYEQARIVGKLSNGFISYLKTNQLTGNRLTG